MWSSPYCIPTCSWFKRLQVCCHNPSGFFVTCDLKNACKPCLLLFSLQASVIYVKLFVNEQNSVIINGNKLPLILSVPEGKGQAQVYSQETNKKRSHGDNKRWIVRLSGYFDKWKFMLQLLLEDNFRRHAADFAVFVNNYKSSLGVLVTSVG